MMLDFGGGFMLRRAETADHAALAQVCLRTGDAGADATGREDDPDLLGLIYAIPYQIFEPDFAFAIDGPSGVAGYLFGARDTKAFNAILASKWYPQLQKRVADPDADETRWHGSDWVRRLIHHPQIAVPSALDPYPSHGHIDLLPEARGLGIGTKAMRFLEKRLSESGSRGMHLQVHPANHGAQTFYRRLGFTILQDAELPGNVAVMAKAISPTTK